MKYATGFLITFMLLLIYEPIHAQRCEMKIDKHQPGATYYKMMDTMMTAMAKAPKGKTPGKDFLYQMIPHHEGAINMALYETLHGTRFAMVQLAKSINQEQKNEVLQMKLWLNQKDGERNQATTSYHKEMDATMVTMMNNMPNNKKVGDIDHAFAQIMIPHHQAAINMARVVLKYSNDKVIRSYAMQLIGNEQVEIEQMKDFLK